MRTTRPFSRTAAALVLLAATAACGSSEDGPAASAAGQAGGGVERTCFDAFPEAMGTPDLGNLTMLPEGWPEPSVAVTLCQAFQESDGVRETIGYLTEGETAVAAIDGYQFALSGLGVTRAGDVLTGRSGDTTFEIATAAPDALTIELRR